MNELMQAFETLGVLPGSDSATLRKAWHALVRTYHPDMADPDPEAANRRLAHINAAWDLVSASTDADIAELKKAMAHKRHMAEQRRKEMELQRRRARTAAKAAEDARMQAEQRAEAHSRASEQAQQAGQTSRASAQNAGANRTSGKSDPKADAAARERTQIVSLARRAFETARGVCASDLRPTMRPVYM